MTAIPTTVDGAFIDTTFQQDDQTLNSLNSLIAVHSIHEMTTADSSDDADSFQIGTPQSGASHKMGKADVDPKATISNLLKDREQEWAAVAAIKGPLTILDLPLDVLKEIVKEVTHTNDLTSLALTHSALHNLAIPHIYSRFDIVWPDSHATTDPRTGVDALTYGLATLCMGDIFTDYSQEQQITCGNCGAQNTATCNHDQTFHLQAGQRRMGNQYPQFTRKFSLGNGPAEWVQEYLITKESGKMLGTLVALAVARMINLETFVWDMPTGVLRDVWLALSSLQNRKSSGECRLERVWVRWHDNSEASSISPTQPPSAATTSTQQAGSTLTSVGWTLPANLSTSAPSYPLSYSQSRVEYPTLSALPPLRSLSVLNIDELDYLDEMSVLIAKSQDRLRELRVGISIKASGRDFTLPWDGPGLQQVDHQAKWPGASSVGERRLGGVLGVLLGRVHDIRKKPKPKQEKKELSAAILPTSGTQSEPQQALPSTEPEAGAVVQSPITLLDQIAEHVEDSPEEDLVENDKANASGAAIPVPAAMSDVEGNPPMSNLNGLELHPQSQSTSSSVEGYVEALAALPSPSQTESVSKSPAPQVEVAPEPLLRRQSQSKRQSLSPEVPPKDRVRLEGKLRLHTLELERVSLSVAVLQKAFEWSVLTSLTILDCAQHDRLWVMLRKTFAPTAVSHGHNSKSGGGLSTQYHLNLRKIHTDAASPALISFLKETLAPNTLETLFLQDRKRQSYLNVTIDAIYRGPLKRHRTSLKRLMLDSSDTLPRIPSNTPENARWRAWMPNRDVLNFITSGRMSSLRELSIALDYKDWHHFLQRLPQIPHLRSLNIPFIADHVTPAYDPKELAMQVVDVIVLRPEVELCYMGVSHKCFEILENRPHDDGHGSTDIHSSTMNGGPGGAVTDEDEDEDGSDDDEEEEEEEEEDDNGTAIGGPPADIDPDETESEISDHSDSDTDSYDGSEDGRSKVRLRLREILFYDDKVSIFKARHRKL